MLPGILKCPTVPDPDLEIRGERGGGRSPKNFLVGLKIRWGGGGPPRPLPWICHCPMETFSVNPDLNDWD